MRNRRAIIFFLVWSMAFALMLAMLSSDWRSADDATRGSFSGVDADSVKNIDINRAVGKGDSERILFSQIDGKWRIESPVSAAADEAAVKRVVDAIAFAEPVDELSESDMSALGRTLRDFGLDSPCATVSMISAGTKETCDFGRVTPSGAEVYVRKIGIGGVLTLPVQVLHEIRRPLGEFRRRGLFTISKADVVGVALKSANGPFSKLTKDKDVWRLTEPVESPADRRVVDEIVEALCGARVIDYVERGGSIAPGLGDNEGYVISLRDSFGTVEKLVLGAQSSTNAVWALTPEGATVHVDDALLAVCRDRQKILEDTRVFPVDMSAIVSFSVADGDLAYVLSRESAAVPWRIDSPVVAPADADTVTNLLSRFLAISGADLVSEADDSRISISMGTAATNYPVRAVSGRFLPEGTRFADLRNKLLLRYPRTEIKRIKVDTAAGSSWDATNSDVVLDCLEKGIVAESVDTIGVSADDNERCGFNKPSYTITFELDDKSSAMRKMLLGAAAPGGGRYATVGGSEAAFVLSAATVSALTKPVEETMKENSK